MTDIAALRVLVVEDDRKISDLLQNYLRASGYVAEAAYDGRDALRQIERQVPDAVILDWMLPGLDGISVCKAVRAFSDVPILMLTARVDEVDRLLGLDTGADDYVCKPFAPREVVDVCCGWRNSLGYSVLDRRRAGGEGCFGESGEVTSLRVR